MIFTIGKAVKVRSSELGVRNLPNAECGMWNAERYRENSIPNSQNSKLRTPNSALGITLIELLVVMSVIGLLAGLGVPAMSSYSRSIKLKATTRKVVRLLSYARSMALSAHEVHSVQIDSDSHEMYVMNLASGDTLEKKIRLPSSVNIDVSIGGNPVQELQINFRPTGSLTGRTTTIALSNQSKTYEIVVTGATGAVIVQ